MKRLRIRWHAARFNATGRMEHYGSLVRLDAPTSVFQALRR